MNPALLLPLAISGPLNFLLWVLVIVLVIAVIFWVVRRRP